MILAVTGIGNVTYLTEQLHGNWSHEYNLPDGAILKGITIYRKDGTYNGSEKVYEDGKIINEFTIEGTWKLQNNEITYYGRIVAPPEMIQELEPLTAEITKITDERYYFKAIDGTTQYETRIKQY